MPDVIQPSTAQLIAACSAGDADAWDALVTRYERLIYTIPLRYGLTPSEADDVFQTVWLKLLQHLPTLRQPDRVAAWLVTTTRRECWDRRRGADHKRELLMAPESLPDDSWVEEVTPEEIVIRYEQQNAVRQAIDRLEERCRHLLRQLYYEATRPTYAEIAEKLGMPVGAIGPTRARCLEKLRRVLET
ncbi:MAG: RNA polymerase sigma factor [Anaerolineae bacterium]